jgi:hypothetical protein
MKARSPNALYQLDCILYLDGPSNWRNCLSKDSHAVLSHGRWIFRFAAIGFPPTGTFALTVAEAGAKEKPGGGGGTAGL